MGIFGEQIADGAIPEAKLDSATQSKLNAGTSTPAAAETRTTSGAIAAADNGKVLWVPGGNPQVDLTFDAGLADGFEITVVVEAGQACTLVPQAGQQMMAATLLTAGVAMGSANLTGGGTIASTGTWKLSGSLWLRLAASSGWTGLPTVLETQPAWQEDATFDPGDAGFDVAVINISLATGGVDVRCYDQANTTTLDLSPGSPIQIDSPSGPLDLTPLTVGNPVEISPASGWFIFPEGTSNTDLTVGLLHIEESGGGAGSSSLNAADTVGVSGNSANLNINFV